MTAKNSPESPEPPPAVGKAAPNARQESTDIVVFLTRRSGKCTDCGEEFFDGSMIRLVGEHPLCLDCADLGHLEYLPRGNTALTRRASKHSPLRAVVVQWARARQRYERQGILVTTQAIDRAETECLEDAGVREQQRERAAVRREGVEAAYETSVTGAISAAFPGCPATETKHIAAWTCQKHSGRVGRSAAAKSLDPQALKLAVIAHIRHEHTDYDRLLMQHGDRESARRSVRAEIDRILGQWESPAGKSGGGC